VKNSVTKLSANRRRGSTIIEFSFISLLLFMMVFAMFEMDRMVLVMTALADSSRAGVRYAIVHGVENPTTENAIETLIKNFASTGILTPGNLSFTSNYSTSAAVGSKITITVTYPYDPFLTYFPGLRVNLSSTSQGVVTY
jgi:Flp pilus assembly protein TadG